MISLVFRQSRCGQEARTGGNLGRYSMLNVEEAEAISKRQIDQRVLAEQIRLLFDLGRPGSATMFIGILAVGAIFATIAPAWPIALMLANQAGAQTMFNHLRRGFYADPKRAERADKWARAYALNCIWSGATWAIGAVCWLPLVPFEYQALFTLIAAMLCLSSVITRLSYPTAMYIYMATIGLPVLACLALFGGPQGLLLVGLAFLTAAALTGWIKQLHRSNSESIRLRFENTGLVERLERAHTAAEQKRRDAEKAHELLRMSERTRRDLLAMISQGIRAPLAGLTDAAAQLAKDNADDEQVRTIQETSHLIGRMLADAADLTAMESRTLKLDTQVFAPKDQIEQVARLLRHTKLRPGLSLEVDWGNEVPREMVGDPARLQQILTNIASYLLTGTEKGGLVLQAASSNAYSCEAVRFSVTSTSFEGSTQSLDIFTDEIPLPLAHSLYSEEVLGLNIAQRLIGLMGGRIGVDSAPGFGATIWFAVPKHPGLRLQQESDMEAEGTHLVDLARLYMLEDRMGSDAFIAHLQRALDELRGHWDVLSDAANQNDRALLTAAARRLADTSNVLGFTYLSEAARQLSLSPPGTEGAKAHIPGLENRLKNAETTLRQIYPRLSA